MNTIQKIEILEVLMAMFIPNVGALLVIMAANSENADIFSEIEKPAWTPPVWLLAILWCTFYCVIGVASNIVFKNRELAGKWTELTRTSLMIYGAHLIFGWTWGLIFFFKRDIIMALIVMVLTDVTALHLTYLFYKVKPLAGYLIIPHIFWLSFVTIFNCTVITMN